MSIRFTSLWALLILIPSFPGMASEDEIIVDVDFKQLGEAYALLVSFTAAPEIAASKYNIEGDEESTGDTVLKTIKLPLYHEFTSEDHAWRWYLQGTLGYSSLEQKFDLQFGQPLNGKAQFDWTGYGGLMEVGLIFPLAGAFSWAAGIGAGISRLESEADFDNPLLEAALAPALDGTVYNWKTDTSIIRGNLGLLYEKQHGKFGVKGETHLVYSKISTFNESSDFGGFSDYASVFTLKIDVSHPLDFEVFKHPAYVVGHLGQTNFLGDGKDEMGFSAFTEAGASLGVQQVTLGLLFLKGSDVDGWNLVLNYDY